MQQPSSAFRDRLWNRSIRSLKGSRKTDLRPESISFCGCGSFSQLTFIGNFSPMRINYVADYAETEPKLESFEVSNGSKAS
jgi:hypothetical protein